MRIIISTGEASGDLLGAELIQRLISQNPDLFVQSIGGERLRGVAHKEIVSSDKWGVISISEALKVFPLIYLGYLKILHELKKGRPSILILIDFGYLNVLIAKKAKKMGWKIIYWMPPGSWRKERQARDLPMITDLVITPFQWSYKILNEMGAHVAWYGHPIKQLVVQHQITNKPDQKVIALLPGSRKQELKYNLSPIAQALFQDTFNHIVDFAATSVVSRETIKNAWENFFTTGNKSLPMTSYTVKDTYSVLKRSQAGIICSGTATLEAALCKCPQLVMYCGSKMMELEAKILKPKFKYISLPNIILDRPLIPELIQGGASPENIRKHLEPLLYDTPERNRQLEGFEEIDQLLGPEDAIDKCAQHILEFIDLTKKNV